MAHESAAHEMYQQIWKQIKHEKNELTPLRSDLEATRKERLEALRWIRAQTSLVQTNTMNKVLTVNPITVITKFTPEDIILQITSSPQIKSPFLH